MDHVIMQMHRAKLKFHIRHQGGITAITSVLPSAIAVKK